MDRLNLPFFYQLGATLQPLTKMGVTAESNALDILIAAVDASAMINTLFSTYTSLAVCKASGRALQASVDVGFEDWRKYHALLDDEAKAKAKVIPDDHLLAMINKAKEFHLILSAELQTFDAYQVTEKALFSTARLVERAENILPDGIVSDVPKEALVDLNQAGRCLAFDLPTAVGFHTWRAVETVLVAYCEEWGVRPDQRDWGSYIAGLKKAEAAGITVAVLDQIRDLHRNPTMHPEMVLSPEEAIGLFGIAPSVIVAMVNDIRRHRKAKTSPASQSGTGNNEPSTSANASP